MSFKIGKSKPWILVLSKYQNGCQTGYIRIKRERGNYARTFIKIFTCYTTYACNFTHSTKSFLISQSQFQCLLDENTHTAHTSLTRGRLVTVCNHGRPYHPNSYSLWHIFTIYRQCTYKLMLQNYTFYRILNNYCILVLSRKLPPKQHNQWPPSRFWWKGQGMLISHRDILYWKEQI